jgi:hypothetical protein
MNMDTASLAGWMLDQEARALLTRLDRVRPFVLFETMVPAAAPSASASAAIHAYLARMARRLRQMVYAFLSWLRRQRARGASPALMQRRFTLIRLRFNVMMSQFDIFADVITQRSEHETGVWLSGLDLFAADALALPGYYESPAVICYVDRGHGAAIRRARTRLPGGGDNPVAVIRIPRERMVGSGIASSLVHEVGHQAAALLDLVTTLRAELRQRQHQGGATGVAWHLYDRWISEIVADFWSVARVGIASTMGLLAVVSLPRAFVFRVSVDDPHPVPWIRVMLSARIGAALYPHPQWERMASLWTSMYPLDAIQGERRVLMDMLLATLDAFVALLVNHRPPSLRGLTLGAVMRTGERTPAALTSLWRTWQRRPRDARNAPPTILFAVIGQARANGEITPERESYLVRQHLAHWAVKDALRVSSAHAGGSLDRSPSHRLQLER